MWGLSRWGHAARTCGKPGWAERGCRECQARRNRRKGRAAHVRAHRLLRTEDMPELPPIHEERAGAYTVLVRPEVKAGAQIPASFAKFVATDWFRRALRQSERAVPVGSGARPALFLDLGRKGRWLVVPMEGG